MTNTRYYTVRQIGSGTEADPYRPDLPAGASWVGSSDGNNYLIGTPAALPPAAGRSEAALEPPLRAAAEARGLRYAGVLTWRVAPGEG